MGKERNLVEGHPPTCPPHLTTSVTGAVAQCKSSPGCCLCFSHLTLHPPCGVGSHAVLYVLTDREVETGRLSNLPNVSTRLKKNSKPVLSHANTLAF